MIVCVRFTFGQVASFVAEWRRLKLTDEDLQALEALIMQRPDSGAVIPGTGGLRKIRFAPPSWHTGKRGAARVCYVLVSDIGHCYLIALFAKNEQSNLNAAQKAAARQLIQSLRAHVKG
jgi:hypothetical protein